jgi:hypothetical protein
VEKMKKQSAAGQKAVEIRVVDFMQSKVKGDGLSFPEFKSIAKEKDPGDGS